MKREITIGGRRIEYEQKISQSSRRIGLRVEPDGLITLTAPKTAAPADLEKFLLKHSAWLIKKLDYFKKAGIEVIRTRKIDYQASRENALALAENTIKKFNSVYNFDINRISIKNQKSRWGSCSSQKNLNFNFKIVFLPPELAEYVVVHELCHLKELNHSKKFWNLVALACPDYKTRRKALKKVLIS